MSAPRNDCNGYIANPNSKKVIDRFRQLTSGALAGAAEASKLPQHAVSGGRVINSSCAGPWSLMTAQVADVSMQNIDCTHIRIGVQSMAATQNPCEVIEIIGQHLYKAMETIQMQPTEMRLFFCALLGFMPPSLPTNASEVVALINSYSKQQSSCAQNQSMIQEASLQNILFSASSSTKCDDLNLAINKCSISVVCILDGIARAQRQICPGSYQPPGSGADDSLLPLWAIVLIAAFVVALFVGGIVVLRRRKRRQALAAIQGDGVGMGLDARSLAMLQ